MKSVDKGAALLDERLPNWRHYIDTDRLDLSHGCDCILGQVFGEYAKGVWLLAVDGEEYGFTRRPNGLWRTLNDAWRRKVAA